MKLKCPAFGISRRRPFGRDVAHMRVASKGTFVFSPSTTSTGIRSFAESGRMSLFSPRNVSNDFIAASLMAGRLRNAGTGWRDRHQKDKDIYVNVFHIFYDSLSTILRASSIAFSFVLPVTPTSRSVTKVSPCRK